jgi:hypothetical protein
MQNIIFISSNWLYLKYHQYESNADDPGFILFMYLLPGSGIRPDQPDAEFR